MITVPIFLHECYLLRLYTGYSSWLVMMGITPDDINVDH